jgi:effector-binding domain-containing protein
MTEIPEIAVVEVPPMEVLGTEKTGPYSLIPELLQKVVNFMMENNLPITAPPLFICHEASPESVKEANEKGTARVEIAWPVTVPSDGRGDIRRYTLPGGRMVHAVHKGPYETCEPTYLRVFAWIAGQGLTINGPIREVYPNDPREVPPEEILTGIYIPVA